MFRKIVSGLSFSPALVGQLGFYAKRLRKEEATRRLGLLFTALALVMQSFAVFSPPEPANAANDSDLIRGGVNSLSDVLAAYDLSARGKGDFKAIMDYAGVTREEIAASKSSSINSRQFGTGSGAVLSWGRTQRFSSAEGEVKHVVPHSKDSEASSAIFSRPLWRYDSTTYTKKHGSSYDAFIGHSSKIGWFAILKDCGNLVTIKTPQPAPTGTITATCDVISGYAYDARQLERKVNVFLYFGGPPGKGKRVGPLRATSDKVDSPVGKGYGYNYVIPDQLKQANKPTEIYAVMAPHKGWTESMVQLGSAQLSGDCRTAKVKPSITCESLKTYTAGPNKYYFESQAKSSNGGSIASYTFSVHDNENKVIAKKTTVSKELSAKSEPFIIKDNGDYYVSAVINATDEDISDANCRVSFTTATEECDNDSTARNECNSYIAQGKEISNLTQGIKDANKTTASSGDRIEYTIYAENTGLLPKEILMEEQLSDVMEYASISDTGGGTFSSESKVLSWGTVKLEPNEKQTRKFVVQINSSIPATPQGTSEPGSYDCIATNTFGNSTTLYIDCPPEKIIEQTVKELPKTGATTNIIFSTALVATVTYFYARARQMNKEIRIIRRDFNSGTI